MALPIDRRSSDPAVSATVREVTRAARQLFENEVIKAVLRGPLTVAFPAGGPVTVRVVHGLGRAVAGYIVTRLSSPAVISDGAFVSGDDSSTVFYLTASAGPCTAQILFF